MTDSRETFENIKHIDETAREYWFARELMPLLEYTSWRNFEKVIQKAKSTLINSYQQIDEHIVEVDKKFTIAKGTKNQATSSQQDFRLTRLACYAIAQNGDPRKRSIALAQAYFAIQTRKQEINDDRSKAIERIAARRKLSETEKKFGGILNEKGISGKGIAEIKSAGDEALFGSPTKEVKRDLGVNQDKPLADHLPTITIKAKDLATEMTTFKTRQDNLEGKERIKTEHINNNAAVRGMLTKSGIYPENLPAEEDVRKLEKSFTDKELSQIESSAPAAEILEIDIRGVMDRQFLKHLRTVIDANPGNAILRVYYGSKQDVKLLERNIEINDIVLASLNRYVVFND